MNRRELYSQAEDFYVRALEQLDELERLHRIAVRTGNIDAEGHFATLVLSQRQLCTQARAKAIAALDEFEASNE